MDPLIEAKIKLRDISPRGMKTFLSIDDTLFVIQNIKELEMLEHRDSYGDRELFYYKIKMCADKHNIDFSLPNDLVDGYEKHKFVGYLNRFIGWFFPFIWRHKVKVVAILAFFLLVNRFLNR